MPAMLSMNVQLMMVSLMERFKYFLRHQEAGIVDVREHQTTGTDRKQLLAETLPAFSSAKTITMALVGSTAHVSVSHSWEILHLA